MRHEGEMGEDAGGSRVISDSEKLNRGVKKREGREEK